MRFYRVDDMDAYEASGRPYRSDSLREIVDRMPALQRHMIERLYFGGATIARAASEAGISVRKAKETRNAALTTLRVMFGDHTLGSLLATLDGDGPLPVSSDLEGEGREA